MECALCRHDREIRRSHIIPEFLYEAMYDEKHRFHVLSVIEDQKDWMEQKGLREPLLCEERHGQITETREYAYLPDIALYLLLSATDSQGKKTTYKITDIEYEKVLETKQP
jgi:hypothetical protein